MHVVGVYFKIMDQLFQYVFLPACLNGDETLGHQRFIRKGPLALEDSNSLRIRTDQDFIKRDLERKDERECSNSRLHLKRW